MKIRLVGAELLNADGHTERQDEANSRFSEFCERVENMQTSVLFLVVSVLTTRL